MVLLRRCVVSGIRGGAVDAGDCGLGWGVVNLHVTV